MNYFGFIFSFMVPGMVVGGMAATLIGEAARRRRKARRRSYDSVSRRSSAC